MSAQEENGIEFSIVSQENQQQFRLLELPADLLNIITSDSPPTLQLKSRDGSAQNADAVLCTAEKTYNLRQVSTSNTVYVAHQTDKSTDANGLTKQGLQAIAQSDSTLEVLPAARQSAASHITAALPAYTSTGHYTSKDATTKDQLFADIPLSNAECEQGWRDLCCFEMGEQRHSVVPSASVKLMAWKSILETATAMNIDLSRPLDERSKSTIINVENDWPDELSKALLESIESEAAGSDDDIRGQRCARMVGEAVLKDRTGGSEASISTTSFKSAWADLLPEKWRTYAELKSLQGYYALENDGKNITHVEGSSGSEMTADGIAPAEAKSTLGVKRKWHEKFRASKKA